MDYNELNKAIYAGKKIVDLAKNQNNDFYYIHTSTAYTNIYELRYDDRLLCKELDNILIEYNSGIKVDNMFQKKRAVYILVTTYYLILLLNYIKHKKDLLFLSDELDYLIFQVKPIENYSDNIKSKVTGINFNIRHIEGIDTRRKNVAFRRLFLFFSNYIINNTYELNVPISSLSKPLLPKIDITTEDIDKLNKGPYGKIWIQLYNLIQLYKNFRKERINICIYCNKVFEYKNKRISSFCGDCIDDGSRSFNSRKLYRKSLKVKTDYIINYKDKYYNYLNSKQKKEIDKIIVHPSEALDYPSKYKTNDYYVLCNEIMIKNTPQGMKIRPTE